MAIALTTPRTWVTGEVPTASIMNQQVRDNSDYINGETTWTAATLQNAWANFGAANAASNFSTAAYRKFGDMVWIKGTVKNGTLGAAIFTLPAGYRPLNRCGFAIESNNVFGRVDVDNTGVVFTSLAAAAYVQLDGIVFSTI